MQSTAVPHPGWDRFRASWGRTLPRRLLPTVGDGDYRPGTIPLEEVTKRAWALNSYVPCKSY